MTNDAFDKFKKTAKAMEQMHASISAPIMPDLTPPRFELPTSTTNPAKWTYERLVNFITKFEEQLDDEHEIGARLVSFGSTVTFHIEDLGFWGPDIVTFTGTNENGENVQLIQHMSQLSVLLVAMKKLEEKPRRIGFMLSKELEDDD